MLPIGSIIGDVTSGAGLMAASIAVFGFLWQAPAALARKDDQAVRVATAAGGLFGLSIAMTILVAVYLIW
ncbi:MAG: hypothetical protein ACTHNP_07605 [Solirubrobacterales bacterium]